MGSFSISSHVSLYLCYPVRGVVSLGELRKATYQIASVPEVSVTEDNKATLGEHYVRMAR